VVGRPGKEGASCGPAAIVLAYPVTGNKHVDSLIASYHTPIDKLLGFVQILEELF